MTGLRCDLIALPSSGFLGDRSNRGFKCLMKFKAIQVNTDLSEYREEGAFNSTKHNHTVSLTI